METITVKNLQQFKSLLNKRTNQFEFTPEPTSYPTTYTWTLEGLKKVIKVTKCVEVVDNWGHTTYYKGEELVQILKDPESWTDDMAFYTSEGVVYIDGLIGEVVMVGTQTFEVPEE